MDNLFNHRSMSSNEIIRTLNNLSNDELVEVFNKYSEIYKDYGQLYIFALTENRNVDNNRNDSINNLKIEQNIINNKIQQWNTSYDYFKVNPLGTLNESISNIMGSDLLKIGNRVVITLSMANDWFLIYIISNSLITKPNDQLKFDQKLKDGFGSSFRERGISFENDVEISLSLFLEVLGNEFSIDEIKISSDKKELIFDQARRLNSIYNSLI